MFGPSFFLTAKVARYNTGFSLVPQGGLEDSHWVLGQRGPGGARHRLRPVLRAPAGHAEPRRQLLHDRPGRQPRAQVRRCGYRAVDSASHAHQPRQQGAWPSSTPTSTRARFYRDSYNASENRYLSAHLGDTFTKDRFTVNVGVRFDHQTGKKGPATIPGNPLLPKLLPALDFAGDSETRRSSGATSRRASVSPTRSTRRARPCCAPPSRATRASCRTVDPTGTTRSPPRTWSTTGVDGNGDEIVQMPEVDLRTCVARSNIDLNNPGGIGESPNQIDPDYHANIDNEVVVGLDRELAPNLALSVAYTWRKSTDLTADPAAVRLLLVQLDRRRSLRLPPGHAVLPATASARRRSSCTDEVGERASRAASCSRNRAGLLAHLQRRSSSAW